MNEEVVNILSEGLSEEQKNYFIDTLRNISENTKAVSGSKTSHKNMTDSDLLAINFDRIKDIYVNTVLQKQKIYRAPKSNDALYIFGSGENCEWYFIEFKDGIIDNKLTDEVYRKIYDSIVIMLDLDTLDKGKLRIESNRGSLIEDVNENFNFAKKLKSLGYRGISVFSENTFIIYWFITRKYIKKMIETRQVIGRNFKQENTRVCLNFWMHIVN